MRRILALCAAALLLALAPTAAAHIALEVTAPADPIPPFTTASIAVDGAAECADVFLGPPPTASVSRDLALSDVTPAGIDWTGETLTFAAAGCVGTDPGNSHDTGTVLITPDGSVPAFTNLSLEVVCDACEDGGFTIQVGYYANLTAQNVSAAPTFVPFFVALNVSTNYDTDLNVSIAKAGSKATLSSMPSIVKVDSPLPENATSRQVLISLRASGPAGNWTNDEITLHVVATPRGQAGNGTALDIRLPIVNSLANAGNTSSTSSHSATTTSSRSSSSSHAASSSSSSDGAKGSPMPSPVLLLAALAAAAVALRRRT